MINIRPVSDLRNKYPEIARGTTEVVDDITDGHVAVVKRSYNDGDDRVIFIVYNSGKEDKELNLKSTGLDECMIADSMCVTGGEPSINEGVLFIPAKSVLYLKGQDKK